MGTPAVFALIAHFAFWTLLVYGFLAGELHRRSLTIFLILWCAGMFTFPYIPYEPGRAMVSSFVAVLDIALVLTIFKGDVLVG